MIATSSMISNKQTEFSTTLDFSDFRTHQQGVEAIIAAASWKRLRRRREARSAAVRGGSTVHRLLPAPVTRGRNIGSRLVDVVMTGGNRREGTTRPGGSHRHRHRHRGLLWHHRLTTSRHGAVLESQCVKKSADSVVCVCLLVGNLGLEG